MPSDNPYESPQESPEDQLPSTRRFLWSASAVFGCLLVGGVLGAGIGAALGAMVPSYYRSVFSAGDDPSFDPLSVGIGLGLTQGCVFGGSSAWCWSRCRFGFARARSKFVAEHSVVGDLSRRPTTECSATLPALTLRSHGGFGAAGV